MIVNKIRIASLLVLIFYNISSFACDCNETDFVLSYLKADLILKAEIDHFLVDRNGENLSVWKINSIFKGEADSSYIMVKGPLNMIDNYKPKSSCDWTTFVGANYILYLDKYENQNLYYAGNCSRRRGMSDTTYTKELEWLNNVNPENIDVYFTLEELTNEPKLSDLKSKIKKNLMGNSPFKGFIDFEVKIDRQGQCDSFGIVNKTKKNIAEIVYDRNIAHYVLRNPKSDIEMKVSQFLTKYGAYDVGHINDTRVKYRFRLIIYYNFKINEVNFIGD